jgi:hypothetical protein
MYDQLKEQYKSILHAVSGDIPDLAEMGSTGRMLGMIDHLLDRAELEPAQRQELTVLRDEARTAVTAAHHRARVVNDEAIARIVAESRGARGGSSSDR